MVWHTTCTAFRWACRVHPCTCAAQHTCAAHRTARTCACHPNIMSLGIFHTDPGTLQQHSTRATAQHSIKTSKDSNIRTSEHQRLLAYLIGGSFSNPLALLARHTVVMPGSFLVAVVPALNPFLPCRSLTSYQALKYCLNSAGSDPSLIRVTYKKNHKLNEVKKQKKSTDPGFDACFAPIA